MKNFKKIILILFLLSLVLINYKIPVTADVGSFESYDSGSSDSDWSSSSWDSDYGWSSSDWDSDYGWSSGGSGIYIGPSSGMAFWIFVIIIVVAAAVSKKMSKNQKPPKHNIYSSMNSTPQREPVITQGVVEEQIRKTDELFNEEEFNQKVKTLFVKMQNAWTDRNWEEIRTFETDELFEQHKMQIDGYIRNNTINVMDRICVFYSKLYKYEQVGDKDILEVIVKSRMSDYIIDATTKEIVKGDKETERVKFYKLQFIRKTGVKTKPEEPGISTTNCPNCGAPTKITSSGQCEYCKSIITNGDFGWVLNNLEPWNF